MRLLTTLFLLLFGSARAATYYVSAAGNDSNAGTSTSDPWLTIGKVNTVGLLAGDSVSFRGGDTFSGSLLVNPGTPPANEGQRITVTSYGSGQATINPGTSYGVRVQNCGYVTVSNLIVDGPGIGSTGTYPSRVTTTTSTEAGISIYATTTNTYWAGIKVTGNTVQDCLAGIEFLNDNQFPTISFENYEVTNNTVHDCGIIGIGVWGNNLFRSGVCDFSLINRNGVISGNVIYDIPGITGWLQGGVNVASGYGMIHFSGSDCLIERNTTTRCGNASSPTASNGIVGIMTMGCARVTIRYNESSFNYAPSGIDGSAFDFDGRCVDSVMEYNYAHDCDGAGLQEVDIASGLPSSNLDIRYNIVQNCGLVNHDGVIFTYGPCKPRIYNNTVYHSGASRAPLLKIDGSGGYVYNNIFSISGGAGFGGANVDALIGNTYHVGAGSSFSITLASGARTSLAAIRAIGYESNLGVDYGASGDPVFANPGGAVPLMPTTPVEQLSAYDISGASVAHNAGIALSLVSITPPAADWHGNTALSGVDSGAVRYDSTYNPPTINAGKQRPGGTFLNFGRSL